MKNISLTTIWQRQYTKEVLVEMSDVHLRLLHVRLFLDSLSVGALLASLLTPTSTEGRIALFIAFILTRFDTLTSMFRIAVITMRAIGNHAPSSYSPVRDSLLDQPGNLAQVIKEDMGLTNDIGKIGWVVMNLRIAFRSALFFQIIPTVLLIGVGLFALDIYLCAIGWFVISVILAYLAIPYLKPLVGYLFVFMCGIIGCTGALSFRQPMPQPPERLFLLFAASLGLIVTGWSLWHVIDWLHKVAGRSKHATRPPATIEDIEEAQVRALNSYDSAGIRSILGNLRALLLPAAFKYPSGRITVLLWLARLLPGILPALGAMAILGQIP